MSGPFLESPGLFFGPGIKPSVSQNGEVYTAETSCKKGTSVLNKTASVIIRLIDAAFRV